MEAYDCANRNTADTIASENLRKPAVAAEIELTLAWDPSREEIESVLRDRGRRGST